MQPARFRTCLPNGCIAIVRLDKSALAGLQSGTSLKLAVTTASNAPMTFSVSLKGFSAALDRMKVINGG
jgi:invasion protein IalB